MAATLAGRVASATCTKSAFSQLMSSVGLIKYTPHRHMHLATLSGHTSAKCGISCHSVHVRSLQRCGLFTSHQSHLFGYAKKPGWISLAGQSIIVSRGMRHKPFGSKETFEDHDTDKYLQNIEKESEESHGWEIRLANENGYLSWCRNTYIATIGGATMFGQDNVPYGKEAAVLLFLLGGMNLLTGTFGFYYTTWTLRRRMSMSSLLCLTYTSLASLHMLLWLGAAIIYLGYIEEEDFVIIERDDFHVRDKISPPTPGRDSDDV